jgi:hypothetical protein
MLNMFCIPRILPYFAMAMMLQAASVRASTAVSPHLWKIDTIGAQVANMWHPTYD